MGRNLLIGGGVALAVLLIWWRRSAPSETFKAFVAKKVNL
jgi:hypothetical protein